MPMIPNFFEEVSECQRRKPTHTPDGCRDLEVKFL
jgi:hypothetical protein